MGNFNGINEYHDGMVVSEYMNMLPMGDICLDRVGERYVHKLNRAFDGKVRGTFVDSHNNIYIAVGQQLYRCTMTDEGVTAPERMRFRVGTYEADFNFGGNENDKVSFCESTIKPTVVYCCDGTYIYMWNTTSGEGERAPYFVNGQYLPEIGIQDTIEVQPNMMLFITTKSNTGLFNPSEDLAYAKSICWFDNKLVMQKCDSSIVWLSCTDPAQFFRDPTSNPTNPTSGIGLWNSWYSSTASSDSVSAIASFRGSLYFINTHSIEVWGRTGNEDSPIQSSTTQMIHYGGRDPLIVEDVLYLVCIDSVGDEFIGAFSNGTFSRISNKEVERRLADIEGLYVISQRHENYLYVRCNDSDGFLYKDGMWSSWKAPAEEADPVAVSLYGTLAATIYGNVVEFDEDIRTSSNGHRLERYIRDGFQQFDRRVIFRRVSCPMDTGKLDKEYHSSANLGPNQDRGVYVALSTNRGLSFSQRRYRELGKSGHNDKMLEWRNLGSGNSVLLELGTSSLHKLQLYGLKIDAQ